MDSNYTPRTSEVRNTALSYGHALPSEAEWDRWLDEVKAAAWDAGYTRGFYDSQPLPNTADASEGSSENPYQEGVH